MANSNEAMREALETVRKYVKETTPDKVVLGVIEVWCDEALALPRRQCDVGTPEEQRARFDKFCRSNSWDEIDGAHCMSSCPLYHGDCSRCEELEWAQMPYTESEVSHGNA